MPWEHGPCSLWALQTSSEFQALPTQGSRSRSFLTGVQEATAVLTTHAGGQRAARATGSPQWMAQAGARMQVCTQTHLSVHIPCSPPGDTEHSSTWRQPLSRSDIYNQSASSSPGWRTDPRNPQSPVSGGRTRSGRLYSCWKPRTGGKSHVRATKDGAEPEEVTMGSQETLAGPPPTLHRWDPSQTGLHPHSETSVTINISLLCGL